jgi:hypothetical protein
MDEIVRERRLKHRIGEARGHLDLDPLPGLDDPIVAKNMGTGGGTTNLGSDTSAEAGSVDDFSS